MSFDVMAIVLVKNHSTHNFLPSRQPGPGATRSFVTEDWSPGDTIESARLSSKLSSADLSSSNGSLTKVCKLA